MSTDTREALAAIYPDLLLTQQEMHALNITRQGRFDSRGEPYGWQVLSGCGLLAIDGDIGEVSVGRIQSPRLTAMRRAALATQPAQPSRAQKMREAGFTARDTRLTCDECGAKFTTQFAPLHDCGQPAQPSAQGEAPEDMCDLVERAGGHYLTGGDAAFTSTALAKFVAMLASAPAAPAQAVTDAQINGAIRAQQFWRIAAQESGFTFGPELHDFARAVLALASAPAAPAQAVPLTPDQESKAMFVARLENMSLNGDTWLTIPAVLALLNDCDMLASSGIKAAP